MEKTAETDFFEIQVDDHIRYSRRMARDSGKPALREN
jgi:hypothetical protein